MTLEEAYALLDTVQFPKTMYDLTLYNRVTLLRLRKVFSLTFNLSEETIYNTDLNLLFFVKYLNTKKEFDIDKIKLDIIKGENLLTLALRYFEPLDVIEEIKNRIKENNIILNNKLYTASELGVVFNMSRAAIISNKSLIKINSNSERTKIKFWLGSDISNAHLDILHNSRGNDKININNNTVVSLSKINKLLSDDLKYPMERINKGLKVFGVLIEYEKTTNGKSVYVKEDVYNSIVSNRKYYTNIKTVKDITNSLDKNTLSSLANYYLILYNKPFNLTFTYCKKESAINFLNIYNTYNKDFRMYIDNVINTIKTKNTKTYNLTTVLSALTLVSRLKIIKNEFNITTNNVSKSIILKVIEHVMSNFKRYSCIEKTML